MPGVQVLFGFLLTVPFQQRFSQTTSAQRTIYTVALRVAPPWRAPSSSPPARCTGSRSGRAQKAFIIQWGSLAVHRRPGRARGRDVLLGPARPRLPLPGRHARRDRRRAGGPLRLALWFVLGVCAAPAREAGLVTWPTPQRSSTSTGPSSTPTTSTRWRGTARFREHDAHRAADLPHPPPHRDGRRPARRRAAAARRSSDERRRRHPRGGERALPGAMHRRRCSRSTAPATSSCASRTRGREVVLASSAKPDEVEHYLDLLDARELVDALDRPPATSSRRSRAPDLVLAALDEARRRPGRDGRRLDLGLPGGPERGRRDARGPHRRLLRAGALRRGRAARSSRPCPSSWTGWTRRRWGSGRACPPPSSRSRSRPTRSRPPCRRCPRSRPSRPSR